MLETKEIRRVKEEYFKAIQGRHDARALQHMEAAKVKAKIQRGGEMDKTEEGLLTIRPPAQRRPDSETNLVNLVTTDPDSITKEYHLQYTPNSQYRMGNRGPTRTHTSSSTIIFCS